MKLGLFAEVELVVLELAAATRTRRESLDRIAATFIS